MDKFALPTAEDTEKMLRLPVGFSSPLWLMFAGAATAGAAWYWTRAFLRPVNLEAMEAASDKAVEAAAEVIEEVEDLAEALAEDLAVLGEETLEVAAEVADAVAEAAPAGIEAVVLAMALEPVAPPPGPDDLTVMTGIGPKLAAALAEQGVTRFADIAAWTPEDVARVDKALKLMGRVEREAWIAQARRLAGA